MSDETRVFTLSEQMPGQSFENWVRQNFAELARVSQEGGQLSPLSIDLDNLADGHVVRFDATNELWMAGAITIPSELPPPDADYGAITVSGGVWSIDADTVTYDIMQDATQACVIGAAAAGTLEELTIGAGLQIAAGALEATSSGSKIIRNWQPTDAYFPASNYATLDTRNTHPVLDFDTTTQEAVYFRGVMPYNYDGEGIVVEISWAASTATTGTIGWDVSLEDMDGAGLDIDSDGFASAQTITAASVPGTSGHVTSSSVSIANGADMDSLVAGDLFRIRIRRDVATDTATGDAELLMVEMRIQ